MKFCKKCLTTNLRPNAYFDDNDICIACNFSKQEESLPLIKLKQLKRKIKENQRKSRKKKDYDCVVGVSGGKDSTRQAHWVRDRLGLRPLLVCGAYPPKQMTQIGADNLSNLIEMGFDLMVVTPAPKTASELALKSFLTFGNIAKASEMSLFATVPKIAVELGVNMIFWGENPALQVGDSAVEGDDEFDGNKLRNLNTLTDGGTNWIGDMLSSNKKYLQEHYVYPDIAQFKKNKINIFYLGPAWDDWSFESNSTYAALQGLTLRPNEENVTGDVTNASMIDEEFSNINMMLKYYKYGFGRATDNINERIRRKEITRDEGIEIVDKYDGICGDSIVNNFCKYVGITEDKFWNVTNKWVNQDIFSVQDKKRPKRKFMVGVDYDC